MGKILIHYMSLVPTMSAEQLLQLPNGATVTIDNTQFYPILFGGDQLTVAKVRGTQALRDTHNKPAARLQDVIPVMSSIGPMCPLIHQKT